MYTISCLLAVFITFATNFTVGENSINRHHIEFPVSATKEMESESQKNLFFGLFEINQPILWERDPDFKLLSAKITIELKNVYESECFSGKGKEDNKHKSSLIVLSHLLGPAWSQFFEERSDSISHPTSIPVEGHVFGGGYGSCPSEIHSFCIGFNELKAFEPITNDIVKLDSSCSNTSDTLALTIDLTPVIQMWITTQHQIMYEGPRLFSEMIVLSLVVDHIMDSQKVGKALRKTTTNNFVGNHLPRVRMDYIINRNCYTKEKIKCNGDDKTCQEDVEQFICKFRPNCPQNKCGIYCDFEEPCDWEWNRQQGSEDTNGFQLLSGQQVMETRFQMQDPQFGYSGPHQDAMNNTNGHFLVLIFTKKPDQTKAYHITSPWFQESKSSCYIEGMLHMHNMNDGTFKLLLHKEHTTWVPLSGLGNDNNMWMKFQKNIGKTEKPFRIAIEIIPSSKYPSHIAIDNLKFVDCFTGTAPVNCSESQFHCQSKMCISRSQVCDFTKDCPSGEDEQQSCEKMPLNTTCNFEKDQCGWTGSMHSTIKWERTNQRAPKQITGPQTGDHTFNHRHNFSGYYMVVDMGATNSNLLDTVVLNSTYFAPPPNYHKDPSSKFYNSCQLRFYYHMFGVHMGSLHVDVIEVRPNQFHKSTRLLAISSNHGNHWHRESRPLPKLENLYYIEFVATRGFRFAGNIALDDISLSPECVGLGVPQKDLKGYDYVTLRNRLIGNLIMPPRPPLKNITKYVLTTCNNHGREGPTPEQCESAYSHIQADSNTSVTVLTDEGKSGIQVWQVPESRHYTLIAKGASGGRGATSNDMRSRASVVKASFFLQKGEDIYVLVGQEGASVCDQTTGNMPQKFQSICKKNSAPLLSSIERIARASKKSQSITSNAVKEIATILGGGGGGGGGTYVYKIEGDILQPLLVAAGGGGLAYMASTSISPYGRGTNSTLDPMCGSSFPHGAGGGGGWKGTYVPSSVEAVQGLNNLKKLFGPSQNETARDNLTMWISAGQSLVDGGGIGGLPCIDSENWGTVGGFGGGGGGCTAGGAGGGYVGGSAHNGVSSNGEGGISYITKSGLIPSIEPGNHDGPGSLVILPSIAGELCGCEYQCLLLDDENFQSTCVCPSTKVPGEDGKSCVERETTIPLPYLIGIVLVGIVAFACVGLLCIFLYNRYQRRKAAVLRRKVVGGPELQLSRLRAASGPSGVLTEYNPNYEFGGETYTLTDLKEIPRENLRLVKALGQGAFGEVYQGFYKHRAGDAVEMPVAVKTLPELSSNQAEMDFLMEALIMSKFSHPNIVHFIGVCFDKHPRFIILELLAGGDLKTFLRESRPKPDRPSPLTMRDLLLCAVDIAKGCRYLEENHFIHRDIAARNCLLTTKGPGRVVKIADFGMARDIYRADYYKKGGKAMLPVKWMPPEAFLDGIFTSKTDVWSYGVLLWEVLSLGYMPYPGRGNQDVMQLVTNGGRLEPPSNCPPPVYGIMTQCWHPIPEERPTFATLLERVGYCLQDPEVVNSPLPVFQRPPSSERDTTVMRPNSDESCLRIVQGHRSSNSALSTVPPSPGSAMADYLIPLTPYSISSSNRGNSGTDSAVTSPTSPLPESESAQTLLEETEDEDTITKDNIVPGTAKGIETSTTQQPKYVSKKPSTIGNGLTLNPSTLENSTRAPMTYANVGVKKSPNSSDLDEIRC